MPKGIPNKAKKPAANVGKSAGAISRKKTKNPPKKPDPPIQVTISNAQVHNFFDSYTKVQELEEEKAEAVAEVVEVKKPVTEDSCVKDGCKRKGTVDCDHGFCFLCCYDAPPPEQGCCTGHYVQHRKRVEEDRLIDAGMKTKQMKAKVSPSYTVGILCNVECCSRQL